jgi:LacI family transcriptional regulator
LAAIRAGPRGTIALAIGRGGSGTYNERTTIKATVVATRDAMIRYTHPAAAGTRDDAGLSALVRAGSLQLVVHSSPVRVIDPALYLALGVDLTGIHVIQAKSHVSHRLGFGGLTERSVVADTPGPTAADLRLLPYRKRPTPLFPFEDVRLERAVIGTRAPRPTSADAPSLRDVAERAGVSKATASRALANRNGVSATARERILRAATELGYEPNRLAQSLSTGATMTIGYLVRDIASPALPPILLGAEATLRAAGYGMLLANSEAMPELDAEYIRMLRQRRVDGLLLSLADADFAPTQDELRRLTVPFVVIDRELPASLRPSSVLIDHGGGLEAATTHLLELGHRRIGFVGGPPTLRPTTESIAILDALVRSSGVSVVVDCGAFTVDHGSEGTARLLAQASPPTAIIAGNGQILLGIIRALRERDLRVPDDVSVVSVDDLPYLEFLTPPIGTVVRNQYAIGRAAAELLIRRLGGGEPQTAVISTSFTPRSSIAPPARQTPLGTRRRGSSAARS